MSIIDWFAKRKRARSSTSKLNIPGDLWIKCPTCSTALFSKDLENTFKVCSKCQYHFRLTPEERLLYFFDSHSFTETDASLSPVDFLHFKDTEDYAKRIAKTVKKIKHNDAIVIGEATLLGKKVNVGIMNFFYMGGSMGSVVGEKVTRLIEAACDNHHPVLLFTSSGGARMQEGILSLMQMAKTSAALARLADHGVPYITILCDPTTGGTSASYAMLGDVHIAEPDALISFAGPRVIEQTIRQKLPKGFQKSDFLLAHGMIDMVVHRSQLKQRLYDMVTLLDPRVKDVS